jgi:hypothetical protein
MEAAGDGGTILTSGTKRYNGGGTSRSLNGYCIRGCEIMLGGMRCCQNYYCAFPSQRGQMNGGLGVGRPTCKHSYRMQTTGSNLSRMRAYAQCSTRHSFASPYVAFVAQAFAIEHSNAHSILRVLASAKISSIYAKRCCHGKGRSTICELNRFGSRS